MSQTPVANVQHLDLQHANLQDNNQLSGTLPEMKDAVSLTYVR